MWLNVFIVILKILMNIHIVFIVLKRLEFSNVDNFKFNHSITQEDNLSNNTLKQLYHKFLEEKNVIQVTTIILKI